VAKTILITFKNDEDIDIDFNECDVAMLLRGTFAMVEAVSENSSKSLVEVSETLVEYFKLIMEINKCQHQ